MLFTIQIPVVLLELVGMNRFVFILHLFNGCCMIQDLADNLFHINAPDGRKNTREEDLLKFFSDAECCEEFGCLITSRSEERRVGKEGRAGWWECQQSDRVKGIAVRAKSVKRT